MLAPVAKTRPAVVATEAPLMGCLASEVSVAIFEALFRELAAPVRRVGAEEAPIPMAPALEQAIWPNRNEIMAAGRAVPAGDALDSGHPSGSQCASRLGGPDRDWSLRL